MSGCDCEPEIQRDGDVRGELAVALALGGGDWAQRLDRLEVIVERIAREAAAGALRDAADAARALSSPPVGRQDWADWLRARADALDAQ